MSKFDKIILVTGGAGFIGSHVVRLFVNKYPNYKIVNGDALTYAGNLENLKDVQDKPNYAFAKIDITDETGVEELFNQYHFDAVIHLAAESHVDRSIDGPGAFVETNVVGTFRLLNAALSHWRSLTGEARDNFRFHHISSPRPDSRSTYILAFSCSRKTDAGQLGLMDPSSADRTAAAFREPGT